VPKSNERDKKYKTMDIKIDVPFLSNKNKKYSCKGDGEIATGKSPDGEISCGEISRRGNCDGENATGKLRRGNLLLPGQPG
jgi:hypothetical protein